jgi:hypothetical protein
MSLPMMNVMECGGGGRTMHSTELIGELGILHNFGIICPIIATFIINSYQQSGRLFVPGGIELSSD